MLKVIIADDEKIQREGILKHISWQDYDMCVVGCACDGVEALELSRVFEPDILITDIKMPRMNGLVLSQKIKEFLPKIKILIISGYEEFEYAMAAIELNSYAYLLKPVNMLKMREQLARIKNDCAVENDNEKEMMELRKQLDESKPVLARQFIEDLLSGAIKDDETARKKSEFLNILLPEGSFRVFYVEVEGYKELGQNEETRQMFFLGIERLLKDECGRYGDSIIVCRRDGEFTAILCNIKCEGDEETCEYIENIRKALEEKTKSTVTIGVSTVKTRIGELQDAQNEAERAAVHKFYLGSGRCILFGAIGLKQDIDLCMDDKISKLMQHISIGNSVKSEELVDGIFFDLSASTVDERYVKTLCFSIMSSIYRILYEMEEKVENIFGQEDILWDKLYRFETIPDARQWLKNIIAAVTAYIYQIKKAGSTGVADTLKRIIEDKFNEQLSIEDLAKMVYLTPNYICNLFKEKTGENIIDYLTQVRMKKAKQYLTDKEMKIYEIAEKTGYNSTSYFSIVFKHTFGMSPKEYRDGL